MPLPELRQRVKGLMPQAKADLERMVSLKSVYDPRKGPTEDCAKMVDLCVELLSGVGLDNVRGYETSDGSTTVCGEKPGPPGAPTVLLYFHHDVQPSLDEAAWASPPWQLTERDGRWYGRGAADCKGNAAVHLTALRALGDELPVGVRVVGEGSEELGDGGLEEFVPRHPELMRADVILVCDEGNSAVGAPTLTTSLRGVVELTVTVRALEMAVHSGKVGGAAPDALGALIYMLSTLKDAKGNTTVPGLDASQTWTGEAYSTEQLRKDASVLDGVDLAGSASVADMVWARPSITVLGIDCPSVDGSSAVVQPEARALISVRIPPGTDAVKAQDAVVAHLSAVVPWHARVEVERGIQGQPFSSSVTGPAFQTMTDVMSEVYGTKVTHQGDGASIPLCNVFKETFPDAEIMLFGVEEPLSAIHAPNESVDPSEIENMALIEALFMERLAGKS